MMRWLCRLADYARHRARLRKWTADQATGRRGEDLAHRYLERHGFTVVARNYRPPAGGGEIDVVAWQRDILVFVEVKSRHSAEFGAPDRNIDQDKRASLIHAARDYARRAGVPWERIRFDVLSIVLASTPEFSHVPDAFAAARTL